MQREQTKHIHKMRKLHKQKIVLKIKKKVINLLNLEKKV
jgi:hypothetical protein